MLIKQLHQLLCRPPGSREGLRNSAQPLTFTLEHEKAYYMETIEGIAKNIRHSMVISGSNGQTSSHQVVIFELNDTPVEMALSECIHVNDGDAVIVAGKPKRGAFRGMAYFNKTKKVKGKGPIALLYIVGSVFLIIPPIGIYTLYIANQYKQAYNAIDI